VEISTASKVAVKIQNGIMWLTSWMS
jgi:hypothetical protein